MTGRSCPTASPRTDIVAANPGARLSSSLRCTVVPSADSVAVNDLAVLSTSNPVGTTTSTDCCPGSPGPKTGKVAYPAPIRVGSADRGGWPSRVKVSSMVRVSG